MPTVPPARPSSAPSARRRRAHALDEPCGRRRAGVVGTVAVHAALVALLLLAPDDWFAAPPASLTRPEGPLPFEIELSPEIFATTTPKVDPLRFVEVNPAAPENAPDNTPLFGAQNQQAAQPMPTPDGTSATPALDGDGKDDATALVSGLGKEPETPSAADMLAQAFTPPTTPSLVPETPDQREEAAAVAPARAVNPLPGGETLLGPSDGGVGTTVVNLPPVPGAESGPEPVQGTAQGKTGGGYFAGTPAIDRNRPRERPRLAASTVNARNAPTIKNEFGSKNIGAVAYDAKWSAYGEYLQRLIDVVQVQWERLILRSAFYPTSGSAVKVVFRLDSTGAISEVVQVSGSGGELAQRLCVSAITERAPYGEWTDDMRAVLGREQELTFTFFYQ